jgi:hypothetical protein
MPLLGKLWIQLKIFHPSLALPLARGGDNKFYSDPDYSRSNNRNLSSTKTLRKTLISKIVSLEQCRRMKGEGLNLKKFQGEKLFWLAKITRK